VVLGLRGVERDSAGEVPGRRLEVALARRDHAEEIARRGAVRVAVDKLPATQRRFCDAVRMEERRNLLDGRLAGGCHGLPGPRRWL
jgi:hypothetical protein